jgi:hypothetical protein
MRRAAVVTASLVLTARAWAAEITVGPYVQDVRQNGFTVAWDTDQPAEGALMVEGAQVKTRGTRHEAVVIGIEPGRRYRYRVLVDGRERDGAEVATAPRSGASFRFVVYGDTRDGGETEAQLAQAMAAEAPDLAIHTGDLVLEGGDAAVWPRFFRNEAPLVRAVPVYAAIGNHELIGDPEGAAAARWLIPPAPGRTRRYYAFDWGAARFLVLDGNGHVHEQTAWLDAELARAARDRVKHVFAVVHQGPLSMGDHCGAGEEAEWVERFERGGVRAVFSGHDHAYERLERNGVRYFVSGGGGAPIYHERPDCASADRDARRVYVADHHYLRVEVRGDEVVVTAVRVPSLQPIEVVRFSGAERLVASLAPPPGGKSPPSGFPGFRALRGWPLPGLFGGLALVGLLRARKRRRS